MTASVRGSSRGGRLLLGAFVVAALGTFVWGFWIVSGVRQKAHETDAALRSLAWSVLCYRDRFGGWPTSDEAMRSTGGAWLWKSIPAAAAGCPTTIDEAMGGLAWPASFDLALRLGHLHYPSERIPFPRVDARGNPSGIGTLGEVNGWLMAAAGVARETPSDTGDASHP